VEDIVNPTVQMPKTRPCQHTLFLNFVQLRDLGCGGRVNCGVNDVLRRAADYPYLSLCLLVDLNSRRPLGGQIERQWSLR
jgi:hypothetical protein